VCTVYCYWYWCRTCTAVVSRETCYQPWYLTSISPSGAPEAYNQQQIPDSAPYTSALPFPSSAECAVNLVDQCCGCHAICVLVSHPTLFEPGIYLVSWCPRAINIPPAPPLSIAVVRATSIDRFAVLHFVIAVHLPAYPIRLFVAMFITFAICVYCVAQAPGVSFSYGRDHRDRVFPHCFSRSSDRVTNNANGESVRYRRYTLCVQDRVAFSIKATACLNRLTS
jgi:hypothetical protein